MLYQDINVLSYDYLEEYIFTQNEGYWKDYHTMNVLLYDMAPKIILRKRHKANTV